MNSKILILTFVACYQVSVAQFPSMFPNISNISNIPNPLGSFPTPPFFGSLNTNWARPYYAAAAEGWRTYFEQLQQARNQLYQTLSNFQNTPQNTDLKPPVIQAPVHENHQGTQVGTTVTRPTLPQVQNEQVRPQGQVANTHTVAQGQSGSRPPQTVNLQTVTAGARPLSTQIPSAVVPQLGSQIVPQVGSQVPWVGK